MVSGRGRREGTRRGPATSGEVSAALLFIVNLTGRGHALPGPRAPHAFQLPVCKDHTDLTVRPDGHGGCSAKITTAVCNSAPGATRQVAPALPGRTPATTSCGAVL